MAKRWKPRKRTVPRCAVCYRPITVGATHCRACWRLEPAHKYARRILARPLERDEFIGTLDGNPGNDAPENVFVQRGKRVFLLDEVGRGENWAYTALSYQLTHREMADRAHVSVATVRKALALARMTPEEKEAWRAARRAKRKEKP